MIEEQQVMYQSPSQRLTFLERHGISPVLFAFLSLIFIFLLYQIVGGVITFVLFGEMPAPQNILGYRIATGLSQILFLLIPTLLLVKAASFTPKEYLRIRIPSIRALLLPIVGIFSLQQMLQIYLVFQDKIPFPIPENLKVEFEHIKELIEEAYTVLVSTHTLPELFLVLIVIAMIPAFAEEILFRGLVQRSLERGLSPLRGVFMTGVIFGAYHLNPFSLIPLMILGIYLGFLTMRSNSLWVSIAAHFFNNAFACIAVYLHQDDDAIITGNPHEMSLGMLIATFWLFGVIFLVSTYYFIHITKQKNDINTTTTFGKEGNS